MDTKRLLHEQQVHQIKLELQNGEQREAGIFGLHPSHHRPMRRVGSLILLLALIQLLAWMTPPQFDAGGIRGYLPLHTLFEIASIVVSISLSF
jgi:hypothetical protein